MTTLREAAQQADALDDPRMVVFFEQRCKAAAELRRLRAQRDEAKRTVREAHEAGTRLTAQRDALLAALKTNAEAIQVDADFAEMVIADCT